jgi:predicted ATPase/class 3 adenylate cyclase
MPGTALPVGTVTFVFTDIEGSTGLVQDLGDDFASLLDTHHRLVRDTVVGAGGIVVGTEGDGFFCVFTSVSRAVAAVVDVQRALAEGTWPGGATVRVRVGVHTGEGVLGGDDYVGLDVHRASRIASAGHGGQVLLSETTAALVVDELPPGVTIRDLGEHELKDLGRAERLHQLVIEGLENDFPPVRSQRAVSSRLPAALTSFVGRERELDALRRFVEQPGLVSLVGPGGAGKTRLAVEAARSASSAVDGVHLVDLSAIANADLVPSFVASAMSVVDSARTPAVDLVASHIGASRYLLVVDNCEHVVEAAARLATHLLGECPRLTVLATSRQPLDVAGEQVVPVSGLAADGDEPDEAERLFVERAGAVAPHLDIERWSGEITELCRRLDGIPLAIELAAARTNVLTPGDVLSRLDDRFALLRSRSPTALPRHRSLDAAIDWSYDALPPDEQSFLGRLSVFRGGFALAAATAVGLDDGPDACEADAIEILASLVARSLVVFHPAPSGARYELLETIRAYAAIRLEEAGGAATAVARHRDYYLEWARQQAKRLSTSDQLAALDDLEADHNNLRAVMERSLDAGDPESALAMAATLVWFWYVHSHFTEGAYWAGRLLAHQHEAPTRPRVRLLIGAGDFDFRIGEQDRAGARFEEALQGARLLESDSLAMWALAYTATNDALGLKFEEASASLSEALSIAEKSGDFLGVGYCTFVDASIRGWLAVQSDDLALLPPLLGKLDALAEIVRSAGERNMIGHVLQTVGLMAHWMGDDGHAREALEESLVAFTEINTLACASHCLEAIAVVTVDVDPVSAVELLAASSSIRDRVGIKLPPLEHELRRLTTGAARGALGPQDVSAAEERGARLAIAEASALARQLLVGAGG